LNCLLAHLTGARIITAQPDKTTGYCTKEFAIKFFEIGDRVFDTKLSRVTITNAIKQLNELTKAERRRHTFENLLRHVNAEILYLQEELTHLDEARSIKTWLKQRLVAMPLTKSKKQRYKLENALRVVDAFLQLPKWLDEALVFKREFEYCLTVIRQFEEQTHIKEKTALRLIANGIKWWDSLPYTSRKI
jgi:hypothetical protein